MGVELSVVVPVYNEEQSVVELVRRLGAATRSTGRSFELVFVNDASTDETAAILENASTGDQALRVVTLPLNQGQFRATREGLSEARGALVAVLDGDLQDPPELLPALVKTLEESPEVDVVFAVKSSRDDPGWMKLGQAVFHALQNRLARTPFPPGAGSYCLMRREYAKRVGELDVDEANLSAVLAALGVRGASVFYDKQTRRHGTSRVGAVRLTREALASLALTGALERAVYLVTGAIAAAAIGVSLLSGAGEHRGYALLAAGIGAALAAAGRWYGRRLRRRLLPATKRGGSIGRSQSDTPIRPRFKR